MYLFFDTETTGLPRNYKAPASDLNNWPRMIQIGWIVTNSEGQHLESKSFIIRPEGFTIPKNAASVHGITTEKALAKGVALNLVLEEFKALVSKSDVLVAHNMSFDEKIIGAELIRNNIKSDFHKKKKLCTMEASTNFCKLPGNYGYKWPKLSELHIKLFGVDFEEAHDAANDIRATARCFWEMRKRGLI